MTLGANDFRSRETLAQTLFTGPQINKQKDHEDEEEDQMKRHVERQHLAVYSIDIQVEQVSGELD